MRTEKPFENPDELLFRQVHPMFIVEGRVSSQAFVPTPQHELKLSVNRSSMVTPKEAFQLHTTKKNLQSAGVWAVSVKDCSAHQDLSIKEDPVNEYVADPSHALIDFSKIPSRNLMKKTGDQLAAKARERGCQYEI